MDHKRSIRPESRRLVGKKMVIEDEQEMRERDVGEITKIHYLNV